MFSFSPLKPLCTDTCRNPNIIPTIHNIFGDSVDKMTMLMYVSMYIIWEGIEMEKITITEARNNFMKLPDRTAKHEVLAITRKTRK